VKERHTDQAQNAKNFKLCDQLSDEITKLKTKKSKLDSRLRAISQKEKKSKKYFAHTKKCKDPVLIELEDKVSSPERNPEGADVEALSGIDKGTTSVSFL